MDSFFEKDYENLNDAILKAIVSSKEIQKILVKLNKTYNYPQHLCNLTNNALYSSFILEASPLVTAHRKRTTTSSPTKSF